MSSITFTTSGKQVVLIFEYIFKKMCQESSVDSLWSYVKNGRHVNTCNGSACISLHYNRCIGYRIKYRGNAFTLFIMKFMQQICFRYSNFF